MSSRMSMSARHWGELWGDRPGAWAVSEQQQAPVYEQALRHVGIEPGDRVLDLGCGTGVFLRMCADRGALVAGLDASERLLAVARRRVPEADLRVADLQTLPYDDDNFDLVTGFRSFFFARTSSPRCARRAGSPGRARRSSSRSSGVPSTATSRRRRYAIAAIGAAPPQGARERAHWRPQLDDLVLEALGLKLERSLDLTSAYAYSGDAAVVEALLAAAPGAAAVAGPERRPQLRAAILRALAHRAPPRRQLPPRQRVAHRHRARLTRSPFRDEVRRHARRYGRRVATRDEEAAQHGVLPPR